MKGYMPSAYLNNTEAHKLSYAKMQKKQLSGDTFTPSISLKRPHKGDNGKAKSNSTQIAL